MRLTLRLLGLDILDFTLDTDNPSGDDPGDCTTSPVGFALPEQPAEYPMPNRDM